MTKADLGRAVEPLFRDWLQCHVEQSTEARRVLYDAATLGDTAQAIFTPNAVITRGFQKETIIFKPTTPMFYSNITVATDASDFIALRLQCTDPLKTIIYTNEHKTLQDFFEVKEPLTSAASTFSVPVQLRWLPIKLLRGWEHSNLDEYAMNLRSPSVVNNYRKATFKILFAKRFTLSIVELLDFGLWVWRTWLLWQSLEALFLLFTLSTGGISQSNAFITLLKILGTHVFWLLGCLT